MKKIFNFRDLFNECISYLNINNVLKCVEAEKEKTSSRLQSCLDLLTNLPNLFEFIPDGIKFLKIYYFLIFINKICFFK